MQVNLIICEERYKLIRTLLCPLNDSNEQFGFALAGICKSKDKCNILVRKFIYADSSCLVRQSGASIQPDPRFVQYIWKTAKLSNSSIVDFHSHPFSVKNVSFSGIDDNSERESFPKAVKYLGIGPHAAVVLGQDSIDARWFNTQTGTTEPISTVKILGHKQVVLIPTSARLNSNIQNVSLKDVLYVR
jgi:hypothetical protein